MRFYLARNKTSSGPFTQFQVREMLERGEAAPTDLGWHEGRDEWSPLKEIPAFEEILTGLDAPRAPEPVAAGGEPAPARGLRALRIDARQIRPVVRFFARSMDVLLFTAVVALFFDGYVTPVYPASPEDTEAFNDQLWQVVAFNIVILFAWNFIEALFLSRWGTTFGKALLRVEVRNSDGSLLSYRSALRRAFHVWASGQACGLPLLADLFKIVAWFRLANEGTTPWDRAQDLKVSHGIIGEIRILLAIAAFLAIAYLLHLGTAPA